MSSPRRRLSMRKGDHTYVFECEDGQEGALLSALVSLADNDELNFDWFDAAVVSYQMGRPLTSELQTP